MNTFEIIWLLGSVVLVHQIATHRRKEAEEMQVIQRVPTETRIAIDDTHCPLCGKLCYLKNLQGSDRKCERLSSVSEKTGEVVFDER